MIITGVINKAIMRGVEARALEATLWEQACFNYESKKRINGLE